MGPETTDKDIEVYQQKIIELNRLAEIGQLSAGILHEIKNPVSFVNNFSRLSQGLIDEMKEIVEKELGELNEDDIADEKELLDTLAQNLLKINENGKRIERIIQGMLSQSRADGIVMEPVELNLLLEEYSKLAYQSVRAEDKEFNVTLAYHLDPAVGEVSIAKGEFGRVVVNLVNNACYAVNERRKRGDLAYEPVIEVTTHREANEVEIRISDNGIGIPEDIVSKLFLPFFTTKPQGKGTGLGLSLTYSSIVETHKGQIGVTSVPGERTEFRIVIPA
nr:HAMP domain-containing sensor histidine kinase [uncultured Dyadobacter sp.]